jgi:hypothetical protein
MLQALSGFLISVDGLVNHLHYERNCQIYFQTGARKYTGETCVEKEFQEFLRDKISPALVDSKVFSYKNGIISLYGFLERFIEDVVIEYLRAICEQSPDYKSLPHEIRKNHLDASLDHVNKIKRIKGINGDYREYTLRETVKNMHACLAESQSYTLNYDAFISHSSNFRYDSIHEVFTRIGIRGISRSCLNDENLVEALSRRHSPSGALDKKLLISLLISELDDLAQRRNEIAHGVRIDEIESLDILQDRIDVIRKYCLAIHSVVLQHLNAHLYMTVRKVDLGKPSKVYGGIRVLEFQGLPYLQGQEECARISVGDKVFVVNENNVNEVVSGEIISMRNPGGDVELLEVPVNTPFSIGVDFKTSSHMLKRKVFVGVLA